MEEHSIDKGEIPRGCINWKRILLIAAVVLVLATAVVVPTVLLTLKKEEPPPSAIEQDRVECPISESLRAFDRRDACHKIGCLWIPSSIGPSCHLPRTSNHVVISSSSEDEQRNNLGFSVQLKYIPKVELLSKPHDKLTFIVSYDSEDQVTFQLFPGEVIRNFSRSSFERNYDVLFNDTAEEGFSFEIVRRDNGLKIWDTSIAGMVVEDNFLQIASRLPNANLFGLGSSHSGNFYRSFNYKKWPIFVGSPKEGSSHNRDFHPFYMCLEAPLDGSRSNDTTETTAHAVFFNNIHPIEYSLLPEPGLVFRSTKGLLSFTYFIGRSPSHTMKLVSKVLGKPSLLPYWSLGTQIGPISPTLDVIEKILQKDIPVDAFTLKLIPKIFAEKDHSQYEEIKTLSRKRGVRWIVTLDPGQPIHDYAPYKTGLEDNCFIRWPVHQEKNASYPDGVDPAFRIMYGARKGNTPVAFPDMSSTSTLKWWWSLLKNLADFFPFEGIDLVNNEPFSFRTNDKTCSTKKGCWTLSCPPISDDPSNFKLGGPSFRLSSHTICMDGVHGDKDEIFHLEQHNHYGMSFAEISHKVCQDITGRRCQVTSQATSSSYKDANAIGHFEQDAGCSWDNLKSSIIDLMNFNLFGIPFVGSKVCENKVNSDQKLGERWLQLAIFYPLFRYEMDPSNTYLDEHLKKSLNFRYHLLPYFYSIFFDSHLEGDMVIRPLFYEFPSDPEAQKIDTQFLWGPSLMVAPFTEKVSSSLASKSVYFPADQWYQLKLYSSKFEVDSNGEFKSIPDDLMVFVRGGTILPVHPSEENSKLNSFARRKQPLELKVFPKNENAEGFLYWDDGDAIDTGNHFLKYVFNQNKCQLSIQRTHQSIVSPTFDEKNTLVLGLVTLHEFGIANTFTINNGQAVRTIRYNPDKKMLHLYQLNINLLESKTISWILNWSFNGRCQSIVKAEGSTMEDFFVT